MQASSVVDPMLFHHIDLNSVMNIGVKGTFKPVKQKPVKKDNIDKCQKYEKLQEKVDKVVCPYEDAETGKLSINCKYIEQCKLKQENEIKNEINSETNNILGKSNVINEELIKKDKPKRGRPRKNKK